MNSTTQDLWNQLHAATTSTNITRKNRQTGTQINIRKDAYFGWVTECLDHGTVCEHETRKLAISWSAEPKTWCEECQDN